MPPTWRPAMTHTEREWLDGRPGGGGAGGGARPSRPRQPAGALAGQVPGNDPLAERAGEADRPVEQADADDPMAERADAGGPLVERADADGPLVEEVPEPAGLASAGDQERFVARWQ